MKIIDNFLEKDDFLCIKSTFLSKTFPWYYNDSVDYESRKNTLYDFQFTHIFYRTYSPNSPFYHIVEPLIKKLNPISIVRIKANMLTYNSEKHENEFHVDQDFSRPNLFTGIYYVNTNNGKTIFMNGKIIDSVENRMVIFKSNLLHKGTFCTDQKCRLVINFNFFYEKHIKVVN